MNAIVRHSLLRRMAQSLNIRSAPGLLLAALVAIVLGLPAGASAVPLPADAGTLGSRIDSLQSRIGDLRGRVGSLQRRENALQADLNGKLARQQAIVRELDATRAKLARLKARLDRAKRILAKRVITVYKADTPDFLSVVLQADGFAELVEQTTYLRHVAEQDEAVISTVRDLKSSTARETVKLAALERTAATLVAQVRGRRDEVAGAKSQVAAQVGNLSAELRRSRSQLASVTRVQHHANSNAPAPAGGNFNPSSAPAGRVVVRSDGTAAAPPGAPASIQAAVAAGNAIAHKPYRWGGGHGSFSDSGYDCSGSVSYVLHAAGVLSSPLASGGLAGWGSVGQGNWITVFANAGHVYMSVGGAWFDTSGIGANRSRWQTGSKSAGGYAVRHWPGL